jgi:hypothetical protein
MQYVVLNIVFGPLDETWTIAPIGAHIEALVPGERWSINTIPQHQPPCTGQAENLEIPMLLDLVVVSVITLDKAQTE